MVYSTCSMSPYEDEAVIAELLRQFKGQLELVDAREFVPVFKARPGMSDWHVIDDHMAIKKEIHERKESNKRIKVEQRARDAVAAATAATASGTSTATSEVEVAPVDEMIDAVQEGIEEQKKAPYAEDERDSYTSPSVSDPLLGNFFLYFIYFISFISYGVPAFFTLISSSLYFYFFIFYLVRIYLILSSSFYDILKAILSSLSSYLSSLLFSSFLLSTILQTLL